GKGRGLVPQEVKRTSMLLYRGKEITMTEMRRCRWRGLPACAFLALIAAVSFVGRSAGQAESRETGAKGTELARVPSSALAIVHVRLAELRESDLGKKIRQRLPP